MTEASTTDNHNFKRKRNPARTREAILKVAGQLMAKDGSKGLSVSKVAQLAKVNRGTAYNHFKTREQLIKETMAWISQSLVQAVYGDGTEADNNLDYQSVSKKLAKFAMQYPEFARVWLLKVMTAEDPYQDPFWRRYIRNLDELVAAGIAQPELDREAYAVLMLVGTVMWPVWARAKTQNDTELNKMSDRFSDEIIRLSFHGSLVKERNQ